MINYKNLDIEHSKKLWDIMNILDEETNFMMYEPGEREKSSNFHALQSDIQSARKRGDLLLAAEENEAFLGYIWAERGRFNRTAHTAYIVIGILRNYWGHGIGTEFFNKLDEWALENNIVRLELTVECPNKTAIHLYEKNGFEIEGVRKKAMFVNDNYVDEYYMAKII